MVNSKENTDRELTLGCSLQTVNEKAKKGVFRYQV